MIDASGAVASSGIFSLLGSGSTWFDSNSLSLAAAMAPNNRTTSLFLLDNTGGSTILDYVVASVPEPTSLALAAAGMAALAAIRVSRCRRR